MLLILETEGLMQAHRFQMNQLFRLSQGRFVKLLQGLAYFTILT